MLDCPKPDGNKIRLPVQYIESPNVSVRIKLPGETATDERRTEPKALLICPTDRAAVAALSATAPLVNVPIFSRSLIELWLEHLAMVGAKQVLVLATDRPELVRRLVGDGARWGMRVEVVPERDELTPAEARAKYHVNGTGDWLSEPHDVTVLDHLPGMAHRPLFNSYAAWFSAVQAWMPCTATPSRIGLQEIRPGVWVGLRTRVSRRAELRAPCWLGDDVCVRPRAVIGPRAVVGDRVVVEAASEISYSVVGAETFVGKLTRLKHSLAWGSTLIDWRYGSCLEVPDARLLSALSRSRASAKAPSLLGRLAALFAMVLTLPFALYAMARAKLRRWPAFSRCEAVRPQLGCAPAADGAVTYYELIGANVWLRRWPQLWNVARGEFAWVGNRPLHRPDAARLANEFDRLWLAAPIGLVSLADALGCVERFNDEARSHASFYAAQANWRLDVSILARAFSPAGGGRLNHT